MAKAVVSRQGYYEFLDTPAPAVGMYAFYWPVEPGDWWYPNITPVNRTRYVPTMRNHYAPGDVVQFLISNVRDKAPKKQPTWVPGKHTISVWGGDDHYLSMMGTDQTMTTEEVKEFLYRLPNPVGHDYLTGLKRGDSPLFIWC